MAGIITMTVHKTSVSAAAGLELTTLGSSVPSIGSLLILEMKGDREVFEAALRALARSIMEIADNG